MDGRDVVRDPREPAGQAPVEVRAGAVRLDDVRPQRPEPADERAEQRRRREGIGEREHGDVDPERLEPRHERPWVRRDHRQLEPVAVDRAGEADEVDFAPRPAGGLRHVKDAQPPHGRRAEASREALAIQRPPERP